jgi:hypothetical protein
VVFARARASCKAESRWGSAARQVPYTSRGTSPTEAPHRDDDGDEGHGSPRYPRSGAPGRGTRSGRSASASARAAGVAAVQSGLCAFQCSTWHPRPQYLAVLQTGQGLSLTPPGLGSSEAPQLAQKLGATMPLTTLHPPRSRHWPVGIGPSAMNRRHWR